jgi:hypothetical protein
MRIEDLAPRIDYSAPEHVREVIAKLGRTEDVRFSPSNRRLAVAAFRQNRIVFFDISVASSGGSTSVALGNVFEFSSRHLDHPHGLDFVDDDRILVTNRNGLVCLFELPAEASGCIDLEPVAIIQSEIIASPGSVAVVNRGQGRAEALVCNNYIHTITRHALDAGSKPEDTEGLVLKKWLNIPDGISVSREGQWVAVSNHGTHAVLIYEDLPRLNEASDPVGILRHTDYPHGLRFTADDRFIVVADAGSPYLSIYGKDESGWRGLRKPLLSFRALSQEDFLRGRYNVEEGGVKGVDIDAAGKVIACTCEGQPLVFFDFEAILGMARSAHPYPYKSVDGSGARPLPLPVLDSLAFKCRLHLWRLQDAARHARRPLQDAAWRARSLVGKTADHLGIGHWLRRVMRRPSQVPPPG